MKLIRASHHFDRGIIKRSPAKPRRAPALTVVEADAGKRDAEQSAYEAFRARIVPHVVSKDDVAAET